MIRSLRQTGINIFVRLVRLTTQPAAPGWRRSKRKSELSSR